MERDTESSPVSLISGSNILITGGSFVQNIDYDADAEDIKRLHDHVAPTAILNAGGRADPVMCYPGTRREVLARIEKWMEVEQADKRGIFWLSGPAGAGKSAIVQTITERCVARGAPIASFFFFRADPTRNELDPVVGTLLFQLFKVLPGLRSRVASLIAQNPFIFKESIRDQFTNLLEKPVRNAVKYTDQHDQSPVIILIDGLDECSSAWQSPKQAQIMLLEALHALVAPSDSPFIVLVASRTEAHLSMAFNEIGISSASIYLDDTCRPSDDIRLFFTAELKRIKASHSLRDTLSAQWPLQDDIDSVVFKSSGQFTYAATVARFIAESAASPQSSLQIVLGLRPQTKTSPFSQIDALYSYILSQAEDWRTAKDVLAAERVFFISTTWLPRLLGPLRISETDVRSSMSDLTSIVTYTDRQRVKFFHASLQDFLYDKSRSGEFYVDVNDFACRLVPVYFPYISTHEELIHCARVVDAIKRPTAEVTTIFQTCVINTRPPDLSTDPFKYKYFFMRSFAAMYGSDPELHQSIAQSWDKWLDRCNNPAPIEAPTPQHVAQVPASESPSPPVSSKIERSTFLASLRAKFRRRGV